MKPADLPGAGLREQIKANLLAGGHSNVDVAGLLVTVELWRKTARAVGRELGRPVQTLLLRDGTLTVILRDWPATAAEEEQHRRAMRDAMNHLSLTPKPGLRPLN